MEGGGTAIFKYVPKIAVSNNRVRLCIICSTLSDKEKPVWFLFQLGPFLCIIPTIVL